MKPRLFISAVTAELGRTRQLVANVLSRLGYDPVWQDIFGTEPGDLRQVLRDKIDGCDGLIQLVGRGYGAEPPPVVDPVSGVTSYTEFGRVSYTQFEFLYAESVGKKTWLIFADDGCTRDRPVEQLDLPHRSPLAPREESGEHTVPDEQTVPDGAIRLPLAEREGYVYQSERRALQDAWRLRWQEHVHLRHEAASDTELELKIERMKDEFAELRKEFRDWQKSVTHKQRHITRNLVAALVLLAAVAAGVWWTVFRQPGEIVGKVKEQVTQAVSETIAQQLAELKPELIRQQLIKQIDETYQRELGQAESHQDWRKRDEAKRAAADLRDRNTREVDRVLELISATIQAGDASPEFLELNRILREQDVEAALAYVTHQQSSLLDRAAGDMAGPQRELRRTLAPLLQAVQLHQTRGEFQLAHSLGEKLLLADYNWPEAHHEFLWTQIYLGDRALRYETLQAAKARFAAARVSAEHLLKLDDQNPLWQRDLSVSYNRLGNVQLQSGQVTEARGSYQQGLEIRQKLAAADPSDAQGQFDLYVSHHKIASVQQKQKLYEQAIESYGRGLKVLQALKEQKRLAPANEKWIGIVERAISECLKLMAGSGE